MPAWYLGKPEEGIGIPLPPTNPIGTGVTESYEQSCGGWEPSLGSLQEQPTSAPNCQAISPAFDPQPCVVTDYLPLSARFALLGVAFFQRPYNK